MDIFSHELKDLEVCSSRSSKKIFPNSLKLRSSMVENHEDGHFQLQVFLLAGTGQHRDEARFTRLKGLLDFLSTDSDVWEASL